MRNLDGRTVFVTGVETRLDHHFGRYGPGLTPIILLHTRP